MQWALPTEPAGVPAAPVAAPLATLPNRGGGPGRGKLLLIGLMALALVVVSGAGNVASAGNPNDGDVKTHSDEAMDPPTQDNPHVDCDGFWIEGFNMEDGYGHIAIRSWPPTGDRTVVIDDEWTADEGDATHHFLAGPYTLAAGHYRLEVSNGEVEPNQMKFKEFWVDPCEEEPEEPPTSTSSSSTGPSSSSSSSSEPPTSSSSSSSPPSTSTGPSSGPGPTTPPPTSTSTSPSPDPEPEPRPEMRCPDDLSAFPQGDGSIRLAFTPAEGSDGTNVYRWNGDFFEYLGTVTGDGFLDETTAAGEGHAYTVTGLYGDAESTDCPVVEATAIPEFPTVIAAGLAAGGSLLSFVLLSRRKQP